ncbi:MAG: hypothetical protein JWL90_2162 [Chthoniobacteraceae bacterium]|nr:hypothetical protein [Chthoniobacteraceae bacterium]
MSIERHATALQLSRKESHWRSEKRQMANRGGAYERQLGNCCSTKSRKPFQIAVLVCKSGITPRQFDATLRQMTD